MRMIVAALKKPLRHSIVRTAHADADYYRQQAARARRIRSRAPSNPGSRL